MFICGLSLDGSTYANDDNYSSTIRYAEMVRRSFPRSCWLLGRSLVTVALEVFVSHLNSDKAVGGDHSMAAAPALARFWPHGDAKH